MSLLHSLLLAGSGGAGAKRGDWVYDNGNPWSYRKGLTITAATGSGTNYKIGIKVYYGSGTDGTETVNGILHGKVYLSEKCRIDFQDLRLAASDGVTLLSYHVRIVHEKDYALVYVQVADSLSTSSVTIYIYYGKSDATTLSDDAVTFGQTGEFGADFDDGTTTGLTINLAGGTVVSEVISLTQWFTEFNPERWIRHRYNPVIDKRGGKWDSFAIRDFSFVIDEDNYVVRESDKYVAFYNGSSVYTEHRVGIAKSLDGVTWTDRLDSPVIDLGGSGSWKEVVITCGQVIKRASDNRYEMISTGEATGSVQAIGKHYSDDLGATWIDSGVVLPSTDFQFSDESNPSQIGVCSTIKRSDGIYLMVFEGLHDTDTNRWAIFCATSSDMATWSAFNSGYPIFTKTGSGWESVGVANPKIIELGDDEFVLAYNGIDASARWDIGLAYSTDLTSWTRYGTNPILSPVGSGFEAMHVECSSLVKDNPTIYRLYYQGFESPAGQITAIGMIMNFQTRHYHAKGAAVSDGYVIGKDLDGITGFMAELIIEQTADSADASSVDTGLMDFASVPSPMINTSWVPQARFWVSKYNQPDNQFSVGYKNAAGVSNWWNGTGWQTGSAVKFAGASKCIVQIWDDGTNYKANILTAEGGVTLITNPASIAKATVKAFSAGRVFVMAEGMTSHYYLGIYSENMFLRKYVTPEPLDNGASWSSEETP